jgi:ubiquinone/menaquinone biosynthesis C-methylase UbiE
MHTLSCVRPALRPGDAVLDIGCGEGFVLAELAAEHQVMGIDVVDLRATSLPRFARYDGLHVPCPDRSFDVALLTFVLHHVPNELKPVLVREVARVTRRAIVVLEDTPRTLLDRLAATLHGRAFQRKVGSTAAFGFYDQGRWERFFADAGLRVAVSTRLSRLERDWKRPWARSCFVLEVERGATMGAGQK